VRDRAMMGVRCSGGLRSAALAWARAPSGAGSRNDGREMQWGPSLCSAGLGTRTQRCGIALRWAWDAVLSNHPRFCNLFAGEKGMAKNFVFEHGC
jgi:hypothetical protein